MIPIDQRDFEQFNHAAKMIEADGTQAYWSCRDKYGEKVANALIIAWLRSRFNDKPDQYPPPEDLPKKVAKALIEAGLMEDK